VTGFLLVALGGAAGAASRFALGEALAPRLRRARWGSLPVEILAVNLVGSLVIGVVTGALLRAGANEMWRLALVTGFCGGFTTFSTATVGTLDASREGHRTAAAAYALANLLGCVAAVALGLALLGG